MKERLRKNSQKSINIPTEYRNQPEKNNISDSSHIQHTHTQREGIEKKRDY